MTPMLNLAASRPAAEPQRALVDHPLSLAAIAMASAVVLKVLGLGLAHALPRALAVLGGAG